MDQLINLADNRLINGCIYCGGLADTRDHIPSKCVLEKPFPTNLPVVGCCDSCNQKFSKDEQYFVCLMESVICGSTDPSKIRRKSVSKILMNSPALRQRIENSKTEFEGVVAFVPEMERVNNVMLKLARGHAAFELSQLCPEDPDHFWCCPLSILSEENRENFNAPHFPQVFGEVGSRNMQRFQVIQMTRIDENGNNQNIGMMCNDWINVQEERYRYLAIDDMGQIVIRIVVCEYLACEVAWGV